eukprot:scaffold657632_cov41-Prasinocladus_malaysianus.AAC.1
MQTIAPASLWVVMAGQDIYETPRRHNPTIVFSLSAMPNTNCFAGNCHVATRPRVHLKVTMRIVMRSLA